jgi:hypothetical protein
MSYRVTRRQTLAGLAAATLAAPAFAQPRELEVPFVATPHMLVQRMLDLAGVQAADYLSALRIEEASAAARIAGVADRVRFRRQDLFETPIFDASVVALYLLPAVNLRLRPRLLTELPAGARVVSHAFDMGDWEPDAAETHDNRRIFLWHVPAVAGGSWQVTLPDGSLAALELEQRFQIVSGTLTGGGRSLQVDGRLSGRTLALASADRALQLSAEVGDSAMSGQGWSAQRIA